MDIAGRNSNQKKNTILGKVGCNRDGPCNKNAQVKVLLLGPGRS